MQISFRKIIKVSVILCIVLTFLRVYSYRVENIEFTVKNEEKSAIVFLPDEKGTYPGVYYAYTKYRAVTPCMIATAKYLADNGIICMMFSNKAFKDNPGPQFFQKAIDDGIDAVDYLRSREDVYSNKIGVLGHSFGATVAELINVNVGNISAVVMLGMISTSKQNVRSNIMIGLGAMDEFRTYNDAVKSITLVTGNSAAEVGEVYGDMDNYNARLLLISPYSEHFGETYDPILLSSMLNWFQRSFGIKQDKVHRFSPIIVHLVVRFLISAICFIIFLMIFLKISTRYENKRTIQRIITFILSLVFIFLIWKFPFRIFSKEIIFSIILADLIVNHLIYKNLKSILMKTSLIFLIIILCFSSGLLVNSFQFILNHPKLTLKLILGLLAQIIILPVAGYEYLVAYFVGGLRSFPLLTAPVFYLLVFEIICPGYTNLIKIKKIKKKPSPKKMLWVFIILILVLVVLVIIRFNQGFIDEASTLVLRRLFLRVVLMPLMIFVLISRSKLWKRIKDI
ncbi:hypothetical protein KAU33_11445 [Candidatus Dependentiae bacterium]|nr:hypothetical protein [Candidatus Dependentiae bacterium]